MHSLRGLIWILFCVLGPLPVYAATLHITPKDNYSKIEQAQAGDTVLIAPGTYTFRVMLKQKGTLDKPILIRAQDPTQKPVWDLKGKAVRNWPGSYTAGDRGRACWQIKGSHYIISGIIFRNCQDQSSAGLRTINSGPVTVRDCVFENSTNGVTGSSERFVIEHSEFFKNGKLTTAGNPSHNIYIYGGVFILRYSYLYAPLRGQNLHIRARESHIEYNWIVRPGSYPIDLMSCNTQCGGKGDAPITQTMWLKGNLIDQEGASNSSQLIALFSDYSSGSFDKSGKAARFDLHMLHNTVIGNKKARERTQNLVNMRNDTIETHVWLYNNIFHQINQIVSIRDPKRNNWSLQGGHNWLAQGTTQSQLKNSLTGTSPGFIDARQKRYQLQPTSPCRNKAVAQKTSIDKEYYLNEQQKRQYRKRSSTRDLGAFEYNNQHPPVGPYSKKPAPTEPPPTQEPSPEVSISEPMTQERLQIDGGTVEPLPDRAQPNTEPTTPEKPTAPEATSETPIQDTTQGRESHTTDRTAPPQGGCQCTNSSTSTPTQLGYVLFLLFCMLWSSRRSSQRTKEKKLDAKTL